MRILLSIVLCTLVLLGGVAHAQSTVAGYEIDKQATAQAPWQVGEVIQQDRVSIGFDDVRVERRFVGMTKAGYFVVQDFYRESGQKMTDPFVVTQHNGIGRIDRVESGFKPFIDGYFVAWNRDGQKMVDAHYLVGKLEGVWTSWYDNGQKRAEGLYQNGKRQGLWIDWYDNGQKGENGLYQNDKRQGLWTWWYDSGYKQEEGVFQDGAREGIWTTWYDYVGHWKKCEGLYQGGRRQGPWTCWYIGGKKMYEIYYRDGRKDGVWTSWHLNGQKQSEGLYQDRGGEPVHRFILHGPEDDWMRQGVWTRWYDNGQKKSEGEYVNGEKWGVWTEWDKQGNQIKEEVFE